MDIKSFIIDGEYGKIPVLEEKLKSKDNFKFLDIGCQSPLSLIALFHDFGVTELTGIELHDSKRAFEEFNNKNHDLVNGTNSFFEFYRLKIKPTEQCVIPTLLEKNQFQLKILDNIEFEMDMFDFFKSNNGKYDLIIASNVLKFVNSIDELEFLIKKIKDSITENGMIYFRTQPEFAHWSYSSYKEILEKYFKNYTLIDTERILENEMVSYFYNINTSEINV